MRQTALLQRHLLRTTPLRPSFVSALGASPLGAQRKSPFVLSQNRTFLFSRGLMNNPPANSEALAVPVKPSIVEDAIVTPLPPAAKPPLLDDSVSTILPTTPETVPIDASSAVSSEFAQNLDKVISNAADIVATTPAEPALTAITKLGDLHSLGLGGWTSPTGIVQSLLEAFYVSTGMPWWAAIAICTVFLRLALFPLVIKAQRTTAQMANLKPLLAPLQAEIEVQKKSGDRTKQMAAITKLQAVYKEAGVNPFGGLWGIVQMPVFVSMFFGLRGMAELPVPGLATGGMLWFQDLTVMDPTYVLPLVASATMLVVMEAGMEAGAATANPAQAGTMKTVFRVMLIGFIPMTAMMPAAVFVYWVTSNFLTLVQFFALKNDSVRGWLNIPRLKTFPNATPDKGLTAGISEHGMLAVKPMKFGEAWKLARGEAERRKLKSV
ncbi:Mitochondrial inner membrane protein oxa1l [Podochytrium sp. JEL0797]|nr:Mitochondrial inner membrane protein oxa1l [Podochytrium sp. JEL0797]